MLAARMRLRHVLCALLLVACSQNGDGDGNDPESNGNANGGQKPNNTGGTKEPTRRLMLSTTVARLEFGVKLQISGHLLDKEGDAVDDELVSFALVGHPEDSSLDALDARTDAEGVFENALLAGARASAFGVRASAKDAPDAFIDVTISDAGFGSLLVAARYDGERMIAQRSVFAHVGGSCDDADSGQRVDGDPITTLGESQKEARLPGLAAGVSYAVTAIAVSASGTLVARGCVETVVQADTETSIEIAFADAPLARSGAFVMQAELDASGPASVLSGALTFAAAALIVGDTPGDPTPADAEATFLLDAFDKALRSEGEAETMLAKAIATDRTDGPPEADTPDRTLQLQLDVENKGPLTAIDDIGQLTQDDLSQMRLTSALVLLPTGNVPARWQPQLLEALPEAAGAPPMLVDLTLAETVATSRASYMADRDVLDVAKLSFRPEFGALATQVLRGELRAEDDGGHLEAVRETLGCAVLKSWLRTQGYPDNCDASCMERACDRVLAALQDAAEGALSAIDDARPTVAFSGEFTLHDADGDLIAESIECDEFEGEWAAKQKGGRADALSGNASATTIVAAQ
jgi:hypothetical protein